ncbi:MAG: MBL fold metallo-hydrolase [Oligoflexia bacterium]|nr:MBL fold metallo-hydrolase [Oligoflexia bacterium]
MKKIGNYEIYALDLGSFGLDGGAMFGVVPKVLWQKENPADDQNRIAMKTRCLLAIDRANKRNILVDCGLGDKGDEKFQSRFNISAYQLESALSVHKISPHDITDLIATHFHFDHMGGLTYLDENKQLASRFPNAKIWTQKRNWQHAWKPNEKDKASYLQENFAIYQGDSRLQTIDGPEEIYPGLKMVLSEGHTTGMQHPTFFDSSQSLIYCADIIPMSAHVRTAWVMGYDCYPLTTIEEKKKILRDCVEKETIVVFEHCPHMDAATIEWTGKDFGVKESVALS